MTRLGALIFALAVLLGTVRPLPPVTPGTVGVWRSLSQAAFVNPENPLGLGDMLKDQGPYEVARNVVIPATLAAKDALGYTPNVLLWEPFGVRLAPTEAGGSVNILAWDTYPLLCEWDSWHAAQWGPSLREINAACADLWVYYGSPRAWAQTPTDRLWAWSIAPAVEAGAGIVMDAEAVRSSAMAERAYRTVTAAGLPVGVEPWPAPGSVWADRETPAFVLLQTVRPLVRKNWPYSYNADREHTAINVLVPSIGEIDVEEVAGYLARGWNVYLPLDTPAETLAKFKPEPTP